MSNKNQKRDNISGQFVATSSHEKMTEAVNDYLSGSTMRDAARRNGTSSAALCRFMKDNSVTARPKGVIRKIDEDAIVKEYKDGKPVEQLRKQHKISSFRIRMILKCRGVDLRDLRKASRVKLDKDVDLILGMKDSGFSINETAVLTNHSTKSISETIKNSGRKVVVGGKRIYSLNEFAFDSINESSAYWLGFIAGDGCVQRKHGSICGIRVTLHQRDISHIEKLKLFLGYDGPLDGSELYPSLTVNSKNLALSLLKYGITPAKSATLLVSSELIQSRDFWRGLIDADGSYLKSKFGNPIISLVGSRFMIEEFKKLCVLKFGANPEKKVSPTKSKVCFQFMVSGSVAQSLAAWLHEGEPSHFLERKRTTALSFAEWKDKRLKR